MSGPRPDRPGPRKASPGRLLVSKVLVMLALTCAVAYNCRSPNLLDAAAGDASKEPAVQLPFATSKRKIGHTLVQTGPYFLLLHPSYTGTALMATGYFWWAAGPRACLRRLHITSAYAAVVCALIALRIRYEERALEAHFGEAWRLHAAQRWRFVPFLL
ncbi:hypothetical protein ABPG77_007588 [Micractinium sp. CCAP 211/92]